MPAAFAATKSAMASASRATASSVSAAASSSLAGRSGIRRTRRHRRAPDRAAVPARNGPCPPARAPRARPQHWPAASCGPASARHGARRYRRPSAASRWPTPRAARLRGLAQLGLVVRHDAVGLRVIAQRLPLFLLRDGRATGPPAAASLRLCSSAMKAARASGSRLPQAPSSSANAAIRPIRHTRSRHAYPPIPHAEPGNPRRQRPRMASCLAAPPATLRDTNYPEAPTHRWPRAEFVAIEAI